MPTDLNEKTAFEVIVNELRKKFEFISNEIVKEDFVYNIIQLLIQNFWFHCFLAINLI